MSTTFIITRSGELETYHHIEDEKEDPVLIGRKAAIITSYVPRVDLPLEMRCAHFNCRLRSQCNNQREEGLRFCRFCKNKAVNKSLL